MKNNNRITIRVILPEDFKEQLIDTMEEEFNIASKKWNVRLNTKIHDYIFNKSIEQLEAKLSQVFKIAWNYNIPYLDIRIPYTNPHVDFSQGEVIYSIPDTTNSNIIQIPKSTMLLKTRSNGWVIDNDESNEAVSIVDFDKSILKYVFKEVRVAVFYGVGSYAK